MKLSKSTSLRDMLEQLTTEQLDDMLNKELRSDPIDANAVRMIFDVLREREKDLRVPVSQEVRSEYEAYREELQKIERGSSFKSLPKWIGRAASLAAACFLMVLLIPQQAEAGSMWNRLVRWTDEIVEFFSPDDNSARFSEYRFTTDDPGLQQFYDAVTQIGIEKPTVPMKLPEGSELAELKVREYPNKTRVYACFQHASGDIIFYVDQFHTETAREFHKDDTQIKEFTIYETTFHIMRNNHNWVVIWTEDNIECSIFIDCQEDALYEILRSIYRMENE